MYMWIMALIIIVVVIALKRLDGSKTFTGFLGEKSVRTHLNHLDQSKYFIINDLMVTNASGNGTSQIDHVVVFRSGLAVIETKNWAGRVYGKGPDRQWTMTMGKNKYRKLNPIVQNKGHIKALQKAIGGIIPMYNIVVFTSRADLR